jgi:hypothetical protein
MVRLPAGLMLLLYACSRRVVLENYLETGDHSVIKVIARKLPGKAQTPQLTSV